MKELDRMKPAAWRVPVKDSGYWLLTDNLLDLDAFGIEPLYTRSAIDQALILQKEERFVYKQCLKHRDHLWPLLTVKTAMPIKEVCPNCEQKDSNGSS